MEWILLLIDSSLWLISSCAYDIRWHHQIFYGFDWPHQYTVLSYIFLYVLFDDVFAYWITVEDVQECLISRLRLIISSLNISIIYTPRNKKEFTYYYWLLVHHYYYYLLLGLLFRCHWHLNNNMIFINHWRIRDWRPDEYLNSSGLQDRSS